MKIAVIPARGGSKRIPRKNIKPFNGKPIIEYSIRVAIESGCFDKIIVSTDDDDIAGIAAKVGAEIPFLRPDYISDDYSTTADVIKHAINWYYECNENVDYICCIYPTAPFLKVKDIRDGWLKLEGNSQVSYAFSIASFPFPVQRGLLINKGRLSALHPEYMQTRSQDLPEVFHDAGQFYWGKASAFLSDIPLFSEHSVGIPIPRHRVQDIDTFEDWTRAEVMHKVLQELGE